MKLLRWLALAGACALTMSACGSSSSTNSTPSSSGTTSSSSGTTTTSGSSAAVTPPPTTPPTTIQVTTPLTTKPPTGKTVIALICQLPSCARYQQGIASATKALGWSTKFETLSATAPAGSLAEAVAQKPNYIFMSGIPTTILKAPLAQAHAANIPVISGADPETASSNGFAAQIGGTLVPDAENVSRWMINDSGGKANIVAVSIPSFPVLVGETNWMQTNIPKLCPNCKFNTFNITIDDVGGGKVPSLLTGYLQSHPGTNYVFFTFSDPANGIAPVLKNAGFSSVKLTGCCGDHNDGKYVADGVQQAWTIAPNVYSGYTAVDAMARLSVGMKFTNSYLASIFPSPSWVVDSPASADMYLKPTGYDWYGPTGFEQQYQKLEHVG